MTLIRLGARLAVATLIIGVALVAGTALRDLRSGAATAPSATPDGNALGAPSPSASAATGCDALARIAPSIAPPLVVEDLGRGTKRVTSADGGYAVTVPSAWKIEPPFVPGSSSFGQAHMTSFDPKTAPTPDPERWMLPPEVGIGFSTQVWMNADHTALQDEHRFLPVGRSGPRMLARSVPPQTQTPTSWYIYNTSATGDNTASTSGQFGTQGTWPPTFDALPDRCR